MSIKISYAITACNEHEELDKLLTHIVTNVPGDDWQIVVQLDQTNATPEVRSVVDRFMKYITLTEFPLNNNFAAFKNNLKSVCKGEYIFQIDADEIPSTWLLENIVTILNGNSTIDLFWVPRINHVDGLTNAHIVKWGWRVDWAGRVNFPDYQARIFKNVPYISWERPVHEIIKGHRTEGSFPTDDEWCLVHEKTIERQERQNNFYNTL